MLTGNTNTRHIKDNCSNTSPTTVTNPQIDNSILNDKPNAGLLNDSSDTNSIPESQYNLDLSLLDDEDRETRPHVVVPETDSDSETSTSTSSMNSSFQDFSSDDSAQDPDFQALTDLSHTDSDGDNNLDCALSTKFQLLPTPGPSGSSKNFIESKEQNISMTIKIPVDVQSEINKGEPNFDLQPYSIDDQVPSNSALSVDTASPCIDDQNTEKKGRKRKVNTHLWKRNRTKLLRNSGMAYTSMSKTKKEIKEKKMGAGCSDKCKLKCTTKFTTQERLLIFSEYWKTADLLVQRQFIYSNMTEIKPKYRYTRVGSTRQNLNHSYYLPLNGERTRVCKVFFMNTLAISEKTIRTVVKKQKSSLKGVQLKEFRGKHNNHPKLDSSLKDDVRDHINSIPRIESHYCRAQSKREYIEGGLTVAALHRNYVEKCNSENKQHVAYQIYYNIFMSEFNISFWKPKKDQCEECTSFDNSEEKSKLQGKHEEHLKEKSLSREEKEKDKNNVTENFIVSVYDLQAVMPCPRGEVSSFYYISKINLLNFTITELGSKATTCFVWHEGEGARGVNEIGSCVLMYLENLNNKATEVFDVVFYSDNCCGQQKNKFMVSMYQYATGAFPKLRSITHKFLIKGHTQNEGDAVHSMIQRNISRALRSSPIYVPDQYITLIKTAKKKGSPYLVRELTHESFFDLKPLALGNYTTNEDGEKVKWTDIRIIKVDKQIKDKFLYKTSYQEEGFKSVSTLKKRQQKANPSINNTIKKLYSQKLHISQSKKQGILNLVSKNIIPKYYEGFYSNL
ncbi:uncharacterized protein LOC124537590 [Vanessa cardui]|uniref:uncharacterized protein LOC124537590 n=1 Tax=Vanessa cardui TaxID=171605 RepID=UPI001F14050D|nr:uncharacterized protein LOC124537590 [Vanessa cardui]